MSTFLDDHWQEIRERIKARVAANSSAQVMSVINSMIQDKTIDWVNGSQVSAEENLAIVRPLLDSGEYEMLRDGVDIYISINPNYRLNQNIIETNESLQRANTSTGELNTETKKYYKKANSSTRAIIWLSSVGAFISLISATVASIALINNHKQFVIETTPFLQITNIVDTPLASGLPVKIRFLIQNLGKDQAKIDSAEFYMRLQKFIDPVPFLNIENPKAVKINAYSIKESPYFGVTTSDQLLDSATYDSIIQKNYSVYFFGLVHYTNLVNGAAMHYYFNLQLIQQPVGNVVYLFNQNRKTIIEEGSHINAVDE